MLLAFLATSCVGRPPPEATGAEIYEQVCARCHGEDLSGGLGPALGPESNSAEQDDEFLRLTISDGRGRMPSFRNTLSAEQIDRVIEFIRSKQ
ncbi:MAG: c-type cytochrome [Acidimicrobiia bacterium]